MKRRLTTAHAGLVGIFCPWTKSLYNVPASRDQGKKNAAFNGKHTAARGLKKAPSPEQHLPKTSPAPSTCLICFPARTTTAIGPDPANLDMCKKSSARDQSPHHKPSHVPKLNGGLSAHQFGLSTSMKLSIKKHFLASYYRTFCFPLPPWHSNFPSGDRECARQMLPLAKKPATNKMHLIHVPVE